MEGAGVRVKFAKDGSYTLHDERSKADEKLIARLKQQNEKLKEENDKLHELAAHYRERYQSLVNKLVAKVDEVGRG